MIVPPQGQDRAAKLLFDHREMVADLLRGFVHRYVAGDLDFDTLRPLPDEYAGSRLDARRGDRRWLVRRRAGSPLVLLEFQSAVDLRMAARMTAHVGLLMREPRPFGGVAGRPAARGAADGRVYRHAALDGAPGLGGHRPGLARYSAGQAYLLLDVRTGAPDDLPERNRMSVAIRLGTSASVDRMVQVLRSAWGWLGEDEPLLWRAYPEWAERVLVPLRFPDAAPGRLSKSMEEKEMARILAVRAKQWTEEWLQQGIEIGNTQGVERERALLCRLAARRFMPGRRLG